MLYDFFYVIHRHPKLIRQRFGKLCSIFLGAEPSTTFGSKVRSSVELPVDSAPLNLGQSDPKRWHIL
jgi:hypothetical protein